MSFSFSLDLFLSLSFICIIYILLISPPLLSSLSYFSSFSICVLYFIYLVPGRFLLYISARSSLALRYLLTFADFTYLKDNSVKYLSKEASRFDVWGELFWVLRGEKRATPHSSPSKEAINSHTASCVRNMLGYPRFQLMHLIYSPNAMTKIDAKLMLLRHRNVSLCNQSIRNTF